jgi:putative oxidoreductase
MVDQRTAPYAALLLRLALGVLFLAHDAVKIFVFTPAGTAAFFGKLGLPAALAYATMSWELVAAVLLFTGLFARWAALLSVPLMLGTIVMVHGHNGWMFSAQGGGWEYPAFWAAALVVQALLGNGAFALKLPAPRAAATANPGRLV